MYCSACIIRNMITLGVWLHPVSCEQEKAKETRISRFLFNVQWWTRKRSWILRKSSSHHHAIQSITHIVHRPILMTTKTSALYWPHSIPPPPPLKTKALDAAAFSLSQGSLNNFKQKTREELHFHENDFCLIAHDNGVGKDYLRWIWHFGHHAWAFAYSCKGCFYLLVWFKVQQQVDMTMLIPC